MSADPDKDTACAPFSLIPTEKAQNVCDNEISEKNNKKIRTVSFPADDQLVTQYCEPENPWKHGKSLPSLQKDVKSIINNLSRKNRNVNIKAILLYILRMRS